MISNLLAIAIIDCEFVIDLTNPKRMSLFVGVDGGGTKTHAVVIDGSRATLGSFVSGASNQNSVGQAAAKAEVLASINGALREAKKSASDGKQTNNNKFIISVFVFTVMLLL